MFSALQAVAVPAGEAVQRLREKGDQQVIKKQIGKMPTCMCPLVHLLRCLSTLRISVGASPTARYSACNCTVTTTHIVDAPSAQIYRVPLELMPEAQLQLEHSAMTAS